MDRSSHTFKTLRNVAYNFLAYAWPFLFSIFITPVIVMRLGVKDYGLYIFINTVSSFISIVTSGFEGSSTKYLSEYNGRNDREGARRLSGTLHVIFLSIAIAGSAVIMGGFFLGKAALSSVSTSYHALFVFFLLVAGNYFIQTATRLYQVVPNALERFDISSKTAIAIGTASNIGALILVLIGYKIAALFLWQLIIGIVAVAVYFRISRRLLPESAYRLKFDREESLKHVGFGGLSAFDNLARTALFSLDRLLVPIFAGVSSLTYYSLPGNVAMRIPSTSDILAGTIFPTSSNLQAAGQDEKIRTMYTRSTRLISLVSLAISTAIVIYADSIMRYWLGPSFAERSTGILIILAFTGFILSLLSPIASFLMGTRRVKFNTILSATMAATNVIFLIILLPRFGIIGAAWAYLISVLPILYAVYAVEKKYLRLTGRLRYYIGYAAKHAVTIAMIALVSISAIKPLATSFAILAVIGPLTVLAYIALYIVLGFLDPEDLNDIRKFVRAFWHNKVTLNLGADRNAREARKHALKMKVRGMLPGFVLKLIRRRQIPLKAVRAFLAARKDAAVAGPTKTGSVSVVMPCYNHARHLEKALESLLRQTRPPDEIIAIDDRSADDTWNILERFAGAHPELAGKTKISVSRHERNLGQAATLNECIRTASSDLIVIMNDDDYLLRDAVERALEIFRRDPSLALIGGGCVAITDDSQIDLGMTIGEQGVAKEKTNRRTPEEALGYEDYNSINMTHTGSAFSREKALATGLYLPKKERIVKFSDRDFQIRMNLLYPAATFPETPFCFWRSNSSVDSGLFT